MTATKLPLVGYVWYCGDDWCGCTQAKISRRTRNKAGYPNLQLVWEGEFYTDHEQGATTELNRTAQAMRRKCHDLYEQIEWPWVCGKKLGDA